MLVSKTRLLPKHVAKLFFLVCTSILDKTINFHSNWNLGCFSSFCFLFDNVKSSLTCLAIDRQNESSATSCDMFWGITAVLLIRNMLIAVYIWNVKNLDRIKDTFAHISNIQGYLSIMFRLYLY